MTEERKKNELLSYSFFPYDSSIEYTDKYEIDESYHLFDFEEVIPREKTEGVEVYEFINGGNRIEYFHSEDVDYAICYEAVKRLLAGKMVVSRIYESKKEDKFLSKRCKACERVFSVTDALKSYLNASQIDLKNVYFDEESIYVLSKGVCDCFFDILYDVGANDYGNYYMEYIVMDTYLQSCEKQGDFSWEKMTAALDDAYDLSMDFCGYGDGSITFWIRNKSLRLANLIELLHGLCKQNGRKLRVIV